MRYILIIALLLWSANAETITLKRVIASSKHFNKLTQSLDQKSLALEAKNQADNASDPLEVFVSGTKAFPSGAPYGYEHSVGFSKNIKLGNALAKDTRIARLNNQADILDEEQEILTFHQEVKNIYHQHCVDVSDYQSLTQNYNDFDALYNNKKRAYEYQEISKTELLQLAIEKKRLHAQLEQSRMRQEQSKRYLLAQVRIPMTASTRLSCRDTYPITSNVKLGTHQFALTTEAYKKRVESARTAIQRHALPIDSLNLTLQHDKEIDMEKYTIGVSIPLNFTSKRSEKERLWAMHSERAASLKYEETIHQKRSRIGDIQAQLKAKAMLIDSMEKNLKEYRDELLPLVKKSYSLGESTVIEYLLGRQQYYALKQELYATQKEYYQALFTLYSLIEKKE